jgi:uncharacterized protein
MNKLEQLRLTVDRILRQQDNEIERRCGFVHLYGVSATCALLAASRELDVELCAVAGMLHDLSSYETGDSTDHSRRSASRAKELLKQSGAFSPDEITRVSEAIALHSDKSNIDGPMPELLKDADVLQHFLYNPSLTNDWGNDGRLRKVLGELGNIEYAEPVAEPDADDGTG